MMERRYSSTTIIIIIIIIIITTTFRSHTNQTPASPNPPGGTRLLKTLEEPTAFRANLAQLSIKFR